MAASEHIRHPLKPLWNSDSQVLILGTMPSPVSRREGFYYAHPQNRFWRVLAAVYERPIPADNAERAALALSCGVALWDVLASCDIEGAADSTIRRPVPNDIGWLLRETGIRRVFITGQKAGELHRRLVEPSVGVSATFLPSTSAANASWSLERLTETYRAALRGERRSQT